MQELTERIDQALGREEARAERIANHVRLILLVVLTIVAFLNAWSVSFKANLLNFSALVVGYSYGFVVYLRIRRSTYRPVMKYITSCLDITLVFLLLLLYTRIEIPSVALKNYVFLIVFPLVTLTAFRYDRELTLITGALAVALYLALTFYLVLSKSIMIVAGGYGRELFSDEVTYIGQATKVLILCGYVYLVSHLAQYSRRLFVKLVRDELTVRNEKEMTDWELGIASHVQNQFLPHALPAIDGIDLYGEVQQGRSVGGDYYDFIQLNHDKLLVVVADVAGKGVPAALIMAEVRASIHLLASIGVGLEELVHRLNTVVHQSTDKKTFVTLFAAEISISDSRLTYVNAGHPPPLLFTTTSMVPLAKGALPLGAQASITQLKKHIEQFPDGEGFVAYTDGLLEHTNCQNEQFGEERFREYIRTHDRIDAKSFARGLLAVVREFGEGKELSDDVCVAVVRHSNL